MKENNDSKLQEIEALLNLYIEPKVYDAKGNRTLLVIGEVHLDFGETYDDFFRNLEQKADKIFMEGVYDHDACPDPHTACIRDAAELRGIEFSPSKLREKDLRRYFRLSERYDVRGIEDKDLLLDTRILKSMCIKALLYLSGRDERLKQEVLELNQKLKTTKIDLSDLLNIGEDEEKLHQEDGTSIRQRTSIAEMDHLEWLHQEKQRIAIAERNYHCAEHCVEKLHQEKQRIAIAERNRHCVEVIGSSLKPHEFGALIIGGGHCDDGAIISALTERGINVVYVNIDQVVEYNEAMESKK
jgi:hypothetical protein